MTNLSADQAKQVVMAGYEACAREYAAARAGDATPELTSLLERLPESARILDVGCGAGMPVTAALARRGSVVGVDISATQVEMARRNVPTARIIHGDIMAQTFERGSFDAAVATYSLFHLAREEQRTLLARLGEWIRPGGYLLATLSETDDPGYTEPFFGVTMYWSEHEPWWYAERLSDCGFEVMSLGVLEHGKERHPVVLARRTRGESGGTDAD